MVCRVWRVGSSCVQPAYRERPYARLRRLQGRTHGFAAADANPTTRAWLVTLEAEAHALAGSEAPSLRALDQAESIIDGVGEEDAARRPRAAFFTNAYLEGERGVALSRLGKRAAAQQVLEAALGSLDPEKVKTRPRLLSALAAAHVQQGNIDEACRIGSDALGPAVWRLRHYGVDPPGASFLQTSHIRKLCEVPGAVLAVLHHHQ
jgi:tetratricopeptide (TPR) repeat protein